MFGRGAADVLAELARRNGRPVTVTFQVTDRCNYACVHCYQEHTDNGELGFDEVARILGELAAGGVLFLTLMGGEFFMRRDADDILRKSHELGFAIKLLSTGHHIHDKRAELIASLRPIQVDMSLYAATPHLHEAVTRQPGSWERTYQAARRLVARNVPVTLKTPVMDGNAGDMAELARLAREIGADFTYDPKITSMESGEREPVTLRMSDASMRGFYRQPSIASYLAESYTGFDPTDHELRPLHHTPCRAGQQAVSIDPQGRVKPCNALPIVCGDLREQSFDEVWTGSARLDEIRHLRWADLAECNVCELRPYCQRCHGMAFLEQGEMRGPSLEACRHAVVVRDALRDAGRIPPTETAMPPTWDRVHPDGQHHLTQATPARSATTRDEAATHPRRSPALRVLG